MGYSQLLGQAGSVYGARLALEQMRREREAQRYAAVNQALGTAVSGASTGMLGLGQMLDQMEQRKSAQGRAAEQLKYDRGKAAEQMRYDRGRVAADNRYTDAVDSAGFTLKLGELQDRREEAKAMAKAEELRWKKGEANAERRSAERITESKRRGGGRGRGFMDPNALTLANRGQVLTYHEQLGDEIGILEVAEKNLQAEITKIQESITKQNIDEAFRPDDDGFIDYRNDPGYMAATRRLGHKSAELEQRRTQRREIEKRLRSSFFGLEVPPEELVEDAPMSYVDPDLNPAAEQPAAEQPAAEIPGMAETADEIAAEITAGLENPATKKRFQNILYERRGEIRALVDSEDTRFSRADKLFAIRKRLQFFAKEAEIGRDR